jgi:hypothetical protein
LERERRGHAWRRGHRRSGGRRLDPEALPLERVGRQRHATARLVQVKGPSVEGHASEPELTRGLQQSHPLGIALAAVSK